MTRYSLATKRGPLGRYTASGPLEEVPHRLRSLWISHSLAAAASEKATLQFGMVFIIEEAV